MHPERSESQLGISYDQLSSEVRPYADNLEAQVWAVFAKYGIVVGEGLAPSHTGGDKPRPYILDELKAANPTTADLEHLADLLEQLDHIRKTGAPLARTRRELSHLDLETKLQEAREILGQENVYGPEQVKAVFNVDLSPSEFPVIPFSTEDLEKAKKLGMFLILRISQDSEGNPLTASRMNELIQPLFTQAGHGKILYNTDWFKTEPFFTQETPTTPSFSSPSEKGEKLPSAEWKLISKAILPDSTGKNYLDQTKLLRDTLAQHGWLTDEEAVEVTDDKLEALRLLVESDEETQSQEAARILSQLKINQNHRRTFSGALYDITTFFLSSNKRLLENRYDWTQGRSSVGYLVNLGNFGRSGAVVNRWGPEDRDDWLGVVLSR